MALPSNGKITSSDAYEERFGNNATPTGPYTLEQLQSDWQLPETPDDASIFAGKGRAEGITLQATNVSSYGVTLNGRIYTGGGYSQIDLEYQFRYRPAGGSNSTTIKRTDSGDFSGDVSENITVAQNTTYYYELMCRNIHNGGNWIIFNTASFTTPEGGAQ